MSREVRRVPKDWEHPKDERGRFKPLLDGCTYESTASDWLKELSERGLQGVLDHAGNPPDVYNYMPRWSDAEADHLMMYQTTSEGTPISPAFKTPEDLARWLADNKASAFADQTATYEEWLSTILSGSAPSAVIDATGHIDSGVSAFAKLRK